jgi:hypothetical protein
MLKKWEWEVYIACKCVNRLMEMETSGSQNRNEMYKKIYEHENENKTLWKANKSKYEYLAVERSQHESE